MVVAVIIVVGGTARGHDVYVGVASVPDGDRASAGQSGPISGERVGTQRQHGEQQRAVM